MSLPPTPCGVSGAHYEDENADEPVDDTEVELIPQAIPTSTPQGEGGVTDEPPPAGTSMRGEEPLDDSDASGQYAEDGPQLVSFWRPGGGWRMKVMAEEAKVLCELVHKTLEEYGMYHCQSGGYMEQLEKEVDGVKVLVVIAGPYALGRARMEGEARRAWDEDMWVAMQTCMRDTTTRGAQDLTLMLRRAVRWRPQRDMERRLIAEVEFDRNFPELAQERGDGTHHPTDELLLEVQTHTEDALHTSNLLNCFVPSRERPGRWARVNMHESTLVDIVVDQRLKDERARPWNKTFAEGCKLYFDFADCLVVLDLEAEYGRRFARLTREQQMAKRLEMRDRIKEWIKGGEPYVSAMRMATTLLSLMGLPEESRDDPWVDIPPDIVRPPIKTGPDGYKGRAELQWGLPVDTEGSMCMGLPAMPDSFFVLKSRQVQIIEFGEQGEGGAWANVRQGDAEMISRKIRAVLHKLGAPYYCTPNSWDGKLTQETRDSTTRRVQFNLGGVYSNLFREHFGSHMPTDVGTALKEILIGDAFYGAEKLGRTLARIQRTLGGRLGSNRPSPRDRPYPVPPPPPPEPRPTPPRRSPPQGARGRTPSASAERRHRRRDESRSPPPRQAPTRRWLQRQQHAMLTFLAGWAAAVGDFVAGDAPPQPRQHHAPRAPPPTNVGVGCAAVVVMMFASFLIGRASAAAYVPGEPGGKGGTSFKNATHTPAVVSGPWVGGGWWWHTCSIHGHVA